MGSAVSQQNISRNGKYSEGNHGMMLPTLYTPGEALHTAGKGHTGWGNAQEKQGMKDE